MTGGEGDPRHPPRIVLASASPRRSGILTGLGIAHEVDPSEVDESGRPGESAGDRVARLAVEKAGEVARRHPDAWVIGGDTEVVLDGVALGKPGDAAGAIEILTRIQGRAHAVLSSVALLRPGVDPDVEVVHTRVEIRPLERELIEAYVATGEPLDKAGAYAIQGLGSTVVAGISGDYTGVVGLPVGALLRRFERAGFRWHFGAGWRPVPGVRPSARRGRDG
ncbi:MAG: Maf family protein [Longimicrobiales bacterium]|nr:Maf family protein [Longimicrobiales bacterium]